MLFKTSVLLKHKSKGSICHETRVSVVGLELKYLWQTLIQKSYFLNEVSLVLGREDEEVFNLIPILLMSTFYYFKKIYFLFF